MTYLERMDYLKTKTPLSGKLVTFILEKKERFDNLERFKALYEEHNDFAYDLAWDVEVENHIDGCEPGVTIGYLGDFIKFIAGLTPEEVEFVILIEENDK